MSGFGALDRYLDDLEARIDEREEALVLEGWKAFADGRSASAPYEPVVRAPKPPKADWPKIPINDALENEELMILRELAGCSAVLERGGKSLMWIRSNYSVGIVPTMFGARVFLMDREQDCLPNVFPLGMGAKELAETPFPPMDAGWGGHVFGVAHRYAEIFKRYPKIARYVRVDHPDTQGPVDLCELMLGSDMFLMFYDEPEALKSAIAHITEFYEMFNAKWFSVIPPADGYHCYFGRLHRGAIAIRNDSCMNLSGAAYEEFVFPYDQRLFDRFGGGLVHFCGSGHHFIEAMSRTRGLHAIDLSQPHLNKMDVILKHTIDKGIGLLTSAGDYLKPEDIRSGAHDYRYLSVF